MGLRLFPLIAYLASSAYLICCGIRLLLATYRRVMSWAITPRMMLSLKTWGKVGEENGILIYFIEMVFGGLVTLWLIHIFMREWLLVIFVVLALLSDEMRVSSSETLLLEVMIFFDRLAVHNENHQDLFEILPNIIQELPEGRVQKGILEAVLRRRSGESFKNSLKAMRRIDPFLDEFVLTLQHSGGQYVPGLNIILNLIIGRAGRKWDRASWSLLIKDKSRVYVQFRQGAFVTGLWVLIINSFSNMDMVILNRAVIVFASLVLLGLGVLFHLVFTNHWIRRSLVVSIFIIAFVAYAKSLIVSIPAWIQVETISHQSDSFRNTDKVTSQISTLNRRLPAFFLDASLDKSLISGTSNLTSTLTPRTFATMILDPPILISTPVFSQGFNLCCLQSPQPR